MSELRDKNKLIVLAGPTAVGKTALSILLAKRIGGEIISADSMQVYRHMDIGSAKITASEMEGVPHHLIDILEPTEEFNVFLFQSLARQAIKEISSRGNIPIVVGGTGFYIQALLYDIDFEGEEDHSEIRRRLEQEADEKGLDALYSQLCLVDPRSAEAIHPHNRKRLIRALEFYRLNGYPISRHNEREREKKSPYDFSYFVITDERSRLYQKIEERVDHMIEEGLVPEVQRLKEMGCDRNMVSMQGLGYKEIMDFLDGSCTLEEAVLRIKQDTRHFAKRQLTWFRRERDVIWIDKSIYGSGTEQLLAAILEKMK